MFVPEMAYVCTVAYSLATLLLLQPMIARSDFLSPVLDDVCKTVECGKGTCKPSHNSTLFYECECDSGWKQTRSDHDDHHKFLPCIVPNSEWVYDLRILILRSWFKSSTQFPLVDGINHVSGYDSVEIELEYHIPFRSYTVSHDHLLLIYMFDALFS
ncbi:hypothetical protein GH714_020212 [Hevea brasiliensis]|uniref:EGF-like domain-containing protein n=1 Tax=Hevea brasiliensis TaxID=3981 RepID=A0A6A6K9Y0_HEVBR|nr:hypothetical protein GH714_020212 [Hevea brasiliensis]